MTIAEKLQKIAENEQKIYNVGWRKGEEAGFESGYQHGNSVSYDVGYTAGYAEGHEIGFIDGYASGEDAGYINGEADGITKGKPLGQAEMWDDITDNGTRTNYDYVFNNWASKYIRPNRKIIPTTAKQLFLRCKNLKKIEAIYFDLSHLSRGTSDNTGHYYTFYNCLLLEEIEDIGLKPNYSYNFTFANCNKVHTIAKIEVDEDTRFTSPFSYCYELVNLTIEGVIGHSGIKLNWSTKLSRASIENVMSALSTTTSGLSIDFSKIAVNKAFETSEGANNGTTSEEWLSLVNSRPNWTISLI